jgi:polyphosphate:AMP phosphotransferase
MFEAIEGDLVKLDKATYEARAAALRSSLLEAQYRVLDAKRFPVIVVIGGVDGAGKGETVNLLTEWMDPRHILARAFSEATDEERQRPPMWRFWRVLPPKGKMGVFFGSWYTEPIVARAMKRSTAAEFDASLAEIQRFETMLTREGALVVKFWFHLSKKAQSKRLEELARDKRTAWRVTDDDRRRFEHYDDFRKVSERAIKSTSTDDAPWVLVDGRDARARALTVGEKLLAAMSARLERPKAEKVHKPAAVEKPAHRPLLATVDLARTIDKARYEAEMDKWQRELALLSRHPKFAKVSPVLVFEGSDAAGKGGAIRRVTQSIDARIYEVIPTAAPTEEERAQPYLWRFWRHAPRDGRFVIFDRSWYGRVLVERVEGFAAESDWKRAYDEINDFEAQLARAGCPIAKFWLQVSKDEQLRRFEERQSTDWKRFKITEEDWRNRDKWDAYEVAASEMIEKTSSDLAPWTIVEAEDKHYARVKVLKTVCRLVKESLS